MEVCLFERCIQTVILGPHSNTLAGVSSTLLQLCHNGMIYLCSLFVGNSSPVVGTRVPVFLVGDVVAYHKWINFVPTIAAGGLKVDFGC